MKTLFVLLLLLFNVICYSQVDENTDIEKNKHVVYGEASLAVVWNVAFLNYEYALVNKPNRIISPRIGIGKYFAWRGQGTALPLSINCSYGKKKLKFEFDAGICLLYEKDTYANYVNDYAFTGKKGTIFSPLWILPVAGAGLLYNFNRSVFKGIAGVNGFGLAYGYSFH